MPDSIHRVLKSRAALAGMSLSDYLLLELRRVAETPTLEELTRRIQSRPPVNLSVSIADIIREGREER